MPIALALVASALIHAAALLGGGWDLPGTHEADAPAPIDAVLTKPAPPKAAAPAAAPVAKPVPRPHVDTPRPPSVASEASDAVEPATLPLPLEPGAAPAELPPVAPPIAVPPAPTIQAAPRTPVSIALPRKGRVRYIITRGEGGFVVGQSVHTWQHDGFTYTLQSVTETTGLAALFKPARVVHGSAGDITAEGLRPREFRHERVSGVDAASFDWARGVVAYAGREDSVAAGTQDFLSMYYQLVLMAPSSGALDVTIATGRKLESFRFQVLGEESVMLPGGERRAMHLKMQSGNDSIEVWLAVGVDADRRGLPLKIRFTDRKGEIFDQLADDTDPGETQ